MRRLTMILALVICWALLWGCGGGSSGGDAGNGTDPDPPPADDVSLQAQPVQVGPASASVITASLSDEVGAKQDQKVVFSLSQNQSGGEIESADNATDVLGQARAVYRAGAAAGTDVVQARIDPHGQATVEIKVLAVDPLSQNLTIAASPSELEQGEVSVITATLTDADGPVPGIKGSFSFQSNQTSARLMPVDVSTNAQGQLSANYQAGVRDGVDIVEVRIAPSLAATVNITVGTPTATITISPNPLPEATHNIDYYDLLTASGGRPGYTFSVPSGSATPPGVTLHSNGVVSGNGGSMVAGTYSFVVQVEDAARRVKLETISLTVK